MTWEYMNEPTEFDPFEGEMRTALIEAAEMAEEDAQAQLAAYGFVANPVEYERDVHGEECDAFWAFACDLYDEPRAYVLYELF